MHALWKSQKVIIMVSYIILVWLMHKKMIMKVSVIIDKQTEDC